jgi:cell division protein FtsN
MTDRDSESGIEFVLDSRKLIIAFAVLIGVCGCVFVLGFIEGKRQGYQAGSLASMQSGPKAMLDDMPAQPAGTENSEGNAKSAKEGGEEQPLNWYKSVNRREGEPEGVMPPKDTAAKPKSQAAAAKLTYSVQIGAFSKKREAEAKATALRSKGYDCRVEPPHPPEQLYLLKVGIYKTRADAAAIQSRLKKSGINSFIKTN